MTAIDRYFEDQDWEDVVRDKMKFVSDYPDEVFEVISDAIEDQEMISDGIIRSADDKDHSKLLEERQDFDDWSAILDYDESVGPFNRSRRGNGWNPTHSCGSLHDPIDAWRGNWTKMSTDPKHAAEWSDICMMMMLHDRLEWMGWDIDDIIAKLHETDAIQTTGPAPSIPKINPPFFEGAALDKLKRSGQANPDSR